MSNFNRGYYNSQAVQVLNKVEYDNNGNPIGLKESPSDASSCNFGTDRLPRRGGCYKGDGTVYLNVPGILATDTYTKYTGSGDITISNNRIDIAVGVYVYGISIFRSGVLWAYYKMEENYGNTMYDSSGNSHHGTIVNGITTTPETNPNSVHQYQNIKSFANDDGYNLVSGVYIPKNDSISTAPFKDVLGNDLQYVGKVPGRVKFVESNCFQQQTSASYLTISGLLATDTVQVFGSSSIPMLSTNRMDFTVGSKYYGIGVYRSGVLWSYYPMCESIINPSGHIYHDVSGNGNHATLINGVVGNEGKQNEFHYLQKGFNLDNKYALGNSSLLHINYYSPYWTGTRSGSIFTLTKTIAVVSAGGGFNFTDLKTTSLNDSWRIKFKLRYSSLPSSIVLQLRSGGAAGYVASSIYNPIVQVANTWYSYDLIFTVNSQLDNTIGLFVSVPASNNSITFDIDLESIELVNPNFLPKHLTNNTDYLGNALTHIQDDKSFLPSGCFLRQYQQPSLIQADKTSGVWYDTSGEPYDVAYETLTLQDPINEQIFIGNKDKTKKLGPISTHNTTITPVQRITERVVRNVVDDPLIDDPAFSHDVTVTAGDLTYSLYNANGYTMNGIIDWGDGTTQSVNTTSTQTITKTYVVAGTYTVKFTGTMQYLSPHIAAGSNAINSNKIIRINNWGNVGFRIIRLQNSANLISIPNGPITGLHATNINLTYLFYGCSKLTITIPDNLLQFATILTSVELLFSGCTSLTGQIPENLFRYCPNLTTVASAFQGCTGLTGQIPEELLRYNTKLTNISGLFFGCTGLTGSLPENILKYNTLLTVAQSAFRATSISGAIPLNLFKYNTLLTDVSAALRDCPNLTGSIPPNLLQYNINLTTVVYLFRGCTGLTGTIPSNLLQYNTALTSVQGLFFACTGLTGTIPISLLSTNTLITTVLDLFYSCIGLTGAIPALFSNNTLITSYSSTFYNCTGLTSIPIDLFRPSGTATTSFDSTFYGCTGITSIPTGLFDYNTNVTTFASTFRNTRITTIPSTLFVNNTKVTSFSYTFASNPSLAAIPSNLFDTNTLVTTFGNVFSGCTSIISIPTDLFRYNVAVTNMSYVFNNTRITSIPVDIFRYNMLVTNFGSTFAYIGTTSELNVPTSTFYYNTEVTNFASTFAYTKITQPTGLFNTNTKVITFASLFDNGRNTWDIPTGLFANNPLVISFSATFRYYLGTIVPTDLFRYNPEVTTFDFCFGTAAFIRSLPEDLFYYNIKATSYRDTLRQTSNIALPSRLFNLAYLSKVTNWNGFLSVDLVSQSPTGTIQKIWDVSEGGDVTYTTLPTRTDAFNNCTALTNYSEIPTAWI